MIVKELIEALRSFEEDATVSIGVEMEVNKKSQYREMRSVEVRPNPCLDAMDVQIVVRLQAIHDFYWDIKEAK